MLISDTQALRGAQTRYGTDIRTYDDGFGPLWVMRDSLGIMGIVRAQTWESAYEIAEDEFFPEATETLDELQREYGYKRTHVKMVQPNDGTPERPARYPEDYQGPNGTLSARFLRWDTIETPDPSAWYDNELFQEAYGFRPNGPNVRDKHGHGIYAKDLNGEYLDALESQLLAELGIVLDIE